MKTNLELIFSDLKIYPLDYPAFDGRVLIPNGTVENPSSNYDCTIFTTSTKEELRSETIIKVAQSSSSLIVDSHDNSLFNVKLYNALGAKVLSSNGLKSEHIISTQNIETGFYVVTCTR